MTQKQLFSFFSPVSGPFVGKNCHGDDKTAYIVCIYGSIYKYYYIGKRKEKGGEAM